ncbi:MAG: ABC transporter substrate-binding protein [Micromonosporaceae bacterium]|jgi:NitT/TauT family transport system substrate-binding protein
MRRRFAALLFAAVLLAPAACGDGGDGTGNGDRSGDGPDVVTVGLIPIVDVAPIFLGQQQGFFEERDIELDLTFATGGANIVPGVASGEFDFGFSNIISMLLAHSNGVPIKIVCNGNNSTTVEGEDFGALIVRADSPYQTAAGLEGASVATNTLQNIVETVVRESVRQAGGDPDQVNFTELPFPDMQPALEAGDVDAIFVVEPFTSAALAAGHRVLASSYAEAAPDLTVAVYFTSQNLIDNDPDLVRRFTEAMQESLAYADSHPEETKQILLEYTDIPEEALADLILPRFPPEINRESVEIMARLALEDGLLSQMPDLDALLPDTASS